jgi:hypothetical protein
MGQVGLKFMNHPYLALGPGYRSNVTRAVGRDGGRIPVKQMEEPRKAAAG